MNEDDKAEAKLLIAPRLGHGRQTHNGGFASPTVYLARAVFWLHADSWRTVWRRFRDCRRVKRQNEAVKEVKGAKMWRNNNGFG